jgi:hypothetical protein
VIRAFTGPSLLTREQRSWVARRILVEPVADVWRSGAAYGVDSIAARLALAVEADLELYVPFAPHNGTLVMNLAPQATKVVRCTKMSTNAACYRHRNTLMVKGSDHLLAFVKKPADEYYRSGEWMTIGIARRLGIPVEVVTIP